jgi:predicted MPP superfamily phosphohydrolase
VDSIVFSNLIFSGAGLTCGIAGAGFVYAGVRETSTIITETVDMRLRRLGPEFDGLRVAQISDLHFRPYTGEREICATVQAVQATRPDIIVLTGDYVTSTWIFHLGRRSADGIEECAEILRGLHAPLGVYAILGNHDWGTNPDHVTEALTAVGITVLRNQAVAIERGKSRLWIAGTDCAFVRQADLDRTLSPIRDNDAVLLLAHEPDFADHAARYPVDLQLSGHSHGGQIVAPLIGPPHLPPLGKKYVRGRYRLREMELYTNRGIGVVGLPMRFQAAPEVTLLRLDSASGL